MEVIKKKHRRFIYTMKYFMLLFLSLIFLSNQKVIAYAMYLNDFTGADGTIPDNWQTVGTAIDGWKVENNLFEAIVGNYQTSKAIYNSAFGEEYGFSIKISYTGVGTGGILGRVLPENESYYAWLYNAINNRMELYRVRPIEYGGVVLLGTASINDGDCAISANERKLFRLLFSGNMIKAEVADVNDPNFDDVNAFLIYEDNSDNAMNYGSVGLYAESYSTQNYYLRADEAIVFRKYLRTDLSGPNRTADCHVDNFDFAELASQWLKCNDPADKNCD